MADSPTNFFIKDFNTFYKILLEKTIKKEKYTNDPVIDSNIYYELNENKNYTQQIQEYLSKASAGNENHENTKAKYYNQYMNLANMGVGTIGLIYYIYFFMKTKQ
jgi:hypothetical protein